jgi:catechol 2,3-dioxygenase-like lactoylglutathione lyase family enzyme
VIPAPRDGESIAIAGLDHSTISVRDMQRSISFYERVFGFEVVEVRGGPRPHVVMGTRDNCTYRVLFSWSAGSTDAGYERSTFIVDKLEAAREALWNCGVPVVEGNAARHATRSLLIRDPDGHEIEFAERALYHR